MREKRRERPEINNVLLGFADNRTAAREKERKSAHENVRERERERERESATESSRGAAQVYRQSHHSTFRCKQQCVCAEPSCTQSSGM